MPRPRISKKLEKLDMILWLSMIVIGCFFMVEETFAQTFPLPNWFKTSIARPAPADRGKAISDYLNSLTKDGKLKLSQADAIRLVLENNLDIVVDRFDPALSEYNIQSAYRIFDPQLTTTLNVYESTSPQPGAFVTGSNFYKSLNQNWNFNYTQLFQTGTQFQVGFNNSRFSDNSSRNNVNPYYTAGLTVSLVQPLLKNFGFLPNNRPIRIAKNNKEINDYLFAQRIIDLVNQTQGLYWEIVFTREDIKVKQRSLDLATKTNEDNKRQVEIGTLAPIEIVKSESEIANRKEDLITSQFTLQQLEDQFKKLISQSGDPGQVLARVDPVDSTLPPTALKDFDLAQAVAYAIEARPEIKQVRKQIENGEIDRKFYRNQMLPSVNLGVQWVSSGLDGIIRQYNIDPVSGLPIAGPIIAENGWSAALSQVGQAQSPTYAAQLTVQIPVRNRAAQADYAYASMFKRRAENNLKALEQQVALQVRNAYTLLEMQRARIEATQIARGLAEKNLEAEQKKFQLGTSTIRFVLEEQRNLAVAQSNELRSLVDFTKAKQDLDKAMGKTLEENNISIADALAGDTSSLRKPAATATFSAVR
jgi:outer membrane protein